VPSSLNPLRRTRIISEESANGPGALSDQKRFPARLLYAEDDKLVRELTSRTLARAGYEITTVEDGLSAWEALGASNFDLLITDNDMPRLTGVELAAKLRRTKLMLPIILASGSADFFSGEEYRWLGFSAFLQKPLVPDRLLESVARTLGLAAFKNEPKPAKAIGL